MDYEVEINQTGRGGTINYIEEEKSLPFDWEFSMVGADIFVPTSSEWDSYCEKHLADWAKGRRQEILERLSQEVRKQKVQSAKIKIEDHWIQFTF